MRKCTKCGVTDETVEFCKNRNNCKPCKSNIDKQYRENNKETIKQINKEYYQNNKEKIKEYSKNWYSKNSEKIAPVKKQWYLNNQDTVKKSRQKWKENNEEFNKWYMNEYIKNKYHTNINYRIKTILNKRIRDYIKKDKKTLEYVGCNIPFFKKWIEYQFDEHMSWDNMGSYWEFDHVIPCASFDFSNEKDIFKCYNWTNIRPLESKENIIKKDKYLNDIINNHYKLVEQYKKIILNSVPRNIVIYSGME
jgi:hypothetical protein